MNEPSRRNWLGGILITTFSVFAFVAFTIFHQGPLRFSCYHFDVDYKEEAALATFTITFTATAAADLFVKKKATEDNRMEKEEGVTYTLSDEEGEILYFNNKDAPVAILESLGKDGDDGALHFNSGETKRLRLTVQYRTRAPGFYKVELNSIFYKKLGSDEIVELSLNCETEKVAVTSN